MKSNKRLSIDFYVIPQIRYKSHKLNVLKECLLEWKKPWNKFYPNFEDFKYEYEEKKLSMGNEIFVLHCWCNSRWLSMFGLEDEIRHNLSAFS